MALKYGGMALKSFRANVGCHCAEANADRFGAGAPALGITGPPLKSHFTITLQDHFNSFNSPQKFTIQEVGLLFKHLF
jgi:hypothetical protein